MTLEMGCATRDVIPVLVFLVTAVFLILWMALTLWLAKELFNGR